MLSFFFSSRRRHTRFSRDWSSDVCSSDLVMTELRQLVGRRREVRQLATLARGEHDLLRRTRHTLREPREKFVRRVAQFRSEERRVGKECRSGWSPCP